jgi:hypothetical protein
MLSGKQNDVYIDKCTLVFQKVMWCYLDTVGDYGYGYKSAAYQYETFCIERTRSVRFMMLLMPIQQYISMAGQFVSSDCEPYRAFISYPIVHI